MTETIRLLIVDDHMVVREGLMALLDGKPDIEIVGLAADGLEAVTLARARQPDVVLLDLVMPRQDGLATIPQLLQDRPDTRVLVLTSFGQDEQIFAAIKAGALGYLLKDSSAQELVRAIRDVARGELTLHPAIARRLLGEVNRPALAAAAGETLTERELEVLRLLAEGRSNQEIAQALTLSERTVSAHVSHILKKLHVASRTQAALYAVREGLAGRRPGGAGAA
jgi:NarL family two-component system response regulator LiaR